LKKRFCAMLALVLLLSLAPFSVSFAASAPVISTEEPSYAEGDIATLYWTDVGVLSYDVFISIAPYGEKNLVVEDSVLECEYNLGGLPAGRYRANVRGVTKSGKTRFSNVVYFTVKAEGAAEQLAESQVAFLWPVKDDPDYSGSSFAITALDLYFDGGKHGKLQNAIDINHDGMTKRYATREIVATASGIVIDAHKCGHSGIFCPTRSCEGSYVKIAHELPDPDTGKMTDYISVYCHLDPKTITVKKGDEVEQGETIARMGSTGNSSGIHLHFAIRNADNQDLPTLEFFMNDEYLPLLQFKYFKRSRSGNFVTTNGKVSRYSDWIREHYVYSSGLWVYDER
jgi:murein DD-endopeptidase MepM/ murein hydrolase activator NlpD